MPTKLVLPPPVDWGLPVKFRDFHQGQIKALFDIMDSQYPVDTTLAPTGFGKSLIPPALAAIQQARVLVLTSTKALQSQYMGDFEDAGMVDVRGASNYDCPALMSGGQYAYLLNRGEEPKASIGPCNSGMPCHLKEKGCPRFDAQRAAQRAEVVVTNYSYWLAHGKQMIDNAEKEEPIGTFDYLVLDEAHNAAEEVTRALTIELKPSDVKDVLPGVRVPATKKITDWTEWARAHVGVLLQRFDELEGALKLARVSGNVSKELLDMRKKANAIYRAVSELASLKGRWVADMPYGSKHYEFKPVWPAPYVKDMLVRGTPKVVLMSATIRPALLKYLGFEQGSFGFNEYPSSFPVVRRPVYQMPVERVHYKMSDSALRIWMAGNDNIFRTYDDRRAIIHAVSYKRQRWMYENSKHKHRMIIHSSQGTESTVRYFKDKARYDAILNSPSVSTGYDFPGKECEVVVIPKVPYPDPTSELMVARMETDKLYPSVYAAQEIVQMAGRAMRFERDLCSIFITDSAFGQFMSTKNPKLLELLPVWFRQSVQYRTSMPKPLEKLR